MNLTPTEQSCLEEIRNTPGIIQTGLAAAQGRADSSVSGDVKQLLKLGLIEKKEKGRLFVNAQKCILVGVCLGKRETRVSLVDFCFEPVDYQKLCDMMKKAVDPGRYWESIGFSQVGDDAVWCRKGSYSSLMEIVETLAAVAEFALLLSESIRVMAIGISSGDYVSANQDTIMESRIIDGTTIRSVGIPSLLSSGLRARLIEARIDVSLSQNAFACACAELYVGALRGCEGNALCTYLGSAGLGSCLVLKGGRLFQSTSAAAGCNFGHLKVAYEDGGNQLNTCTCGGKGCLEQMLRDTFQEAGCDLGDTAEELAACLNNNDKAAHQVALYLSRAIDNTAVTIDPDYVVLSGRLSHIFTSALEMPLRMKMSEIDRAGLVLLASPAKLGEGENAASIGAGICAYRRVLRGTPGLLSSE